MSQNNLPLYGHTVLGTPDDCHCPSVLMHSFRNILISNRTQAKMKHSGDLKTFISPTSSVSLSIRPSVYLAICNAFFSDICSRWSWKIGEQVKKGARIIPNGNLPSKQSSVPSPKKSDGHIFVPSWTCFGHPRNVLLWRLYILWFRLNREPVCKVKLFYTRWFHCAFSYIETL